jgi:hypothetical protein
MVMMFACFRFLMMFMVLCFSACTLTFPVEKKAVELPARWHVFEVTESDCVPCLSTHSIISDLKTAYEGQAVFHLLNISESGTRFLIRKELERLGVYGYVVPSLNYPGSVMILDQAHPETHQFLIRDPKADLWEEFKKALGEPHHLPPT